MSRRGVTLVEWILLIVAAITLLALAVPAWSRAGRHERLVACQGHLRGLHAASLSAPKDPKALGMAYWTRLPVAPELLRCPMAPAGIQRPCDYLGPRTDPGLAKDTDPIGCDIEDNHGEKGRMGGNVLYKSGEVKALHPMEVDVDPWREAARNKCGP